MARTRLVGPLHTPTSEEVQSTLDMLARADESRPIPVCG